MFMFFFATIDDFTTLRPWLRNSPTVSYCDYNNQPISFVQSPISCQKHHMLSTCSLMWSWHFEFLVQKLTGVHKLVTNPRARSSGFKMAAPAVRICRRCICSQASKTRATRPRSRIDRIVRVDHAGELGADRIYAGQMAILGRTSIGPTIQVCNIIFIHVDQPNLRPYCHAVKN